MPPDDSQKASLIRRWIINPLLKQLKQGTSPEKLSWSISLGTTLGIFPIMGSTSVACLIVGHIFKLNQPVTHLFKTLTYPVHLPMILVFIHLGEKLNGVPPTTFSITELVMKFKENPLRFASDFGMAALYGIEVWAICATILIPLLYFATLPVLRKLIREKQPSP